MDEKCGGAPGNTAIKQRANILYKWSATHKEITMEQGHRVVCRHVLQRRAVTMPAGWDIALRATILPKVAEAACSDAQFRERGLEIKCGVLGAPKPLPLGAAPPAGSPTPQVGCPVLLRLDGGGRAEYLLCAHVEGGLWYCHGGTYRDDEINATKLCATEPFDISGLVLKDIGRDAWQPDWGNNCPPPPKKRVRAHAKEGVLQAAAEQHPQALAAVAACAAWLAEQYRAAIARRPLDVALATAGFESNPWKYPMIADEWASRQHIGMIWAWRKRAEADPRAEGGARGAQEALWNYRIVLPQLHNLLAKGRSVPCPPEFKHMHMEQVLERAAAVEGASRKAPCKYLGAHAHAGDPGTAPRNSFERDPARFPLHACGEHGRKSHAQVWFEWVGVQRESDSTQGLRPHRVRVAVDDVGYHGRPVPQNPLGPTAPQGLHLSLAFMEQVAANTMDGIIYQGTSVEGGGRDGRPDFLYDVPGDGRDIQDEPVHWLLPGGKCVCWSARQLAMAQAVDLTDPQTREAYELVAEKFNFCCIGAQYHEKIKEFLADPGTLAEGRWKQLVGDPPASERAPCWWVVLNKDETQPPRLLCRDFASLVLELRQHRVATMARLSQEKARRLAENKAAIAVLRDYERLWADAQGPGLAELLDPTEVTVDAAQQAAELLQRLAREGALTHQSLARLTEDDKATTIARLHQAAFAVQGTGWDVIRRQRFTCTPDGLWDEITKAVDTDAERCRGRASRRAAQPAAMAAADINEEGEPEDEECEWTKPAPAAGAATKDPRVDPDEFKRTSGRKPYNWQEAVAMASDVHIASMRLLLEVFFYTCFFHLRVRIISRTVAVYDSRGGGSPASRYPLHTCMRTGPSQRI